MSENPYEPPTSNGRAVAPPKRSYWRLGGAILILIAMLPASFIAATTICFSVVDGMPSGKDDFYGVGPAVIALIIGTLGGVIVCALLLWWAIALLQKGAEPPRNQTSTGGLKSLDASDLYVERPRNWTKTSGTRINAVFVSLDEAEVVLKKVDGTQSRIPLKELSEADREWVEERR